MERFQPIDAPAVPLSIANVNTDQIIPARFLRKPREPGLAQYLFHDLRFDEGGVPRPDFVLNWPDYRGARIIVAERNFGCGSSREYAVVALCDYGIRAVIAPSFGDIFFDNCFQNGLLPIVQPEPQTEALRALLAASPGAHLRVDLAAQLVEAPDGARYAFDIDPFRKHCLLEGIDELAFTLGHSAEIAAFEERQAAATPWL
ncbi:MAG TPA: 3-isopropylmalate dehydratase small subunit [Stellaceae bacterium]|nr:3-isopropylmalate dehydratase small subunit [Stellaceae bacterium]